jgi:hypothetical protein
LPTTLRRVWSKANLSINDPTGRNVDSIAFGNMLSYNRYDGDHFDYLIAILP